MIIHLFLPDFRSFVRSKSLSSSKNVHPVYYFETNNKIWFYKPIESIIYSTEIEKKKLFKEFTVVGLKQEFQAIEIPRRPDEPKAFSGTII